MAKTTKTKQVSYGYDIDISFVLKDKEFEIVNDSIKCLIVSYDYDNMVCPIIYLTVNLEISLYNKMVLNKDEGKILLDIKKYSKKDKTKAKKSYIKGHFTYFFSKMDDIRPEEDDKKNKENKSKVAYKTIHMGLLDTDIIDDNNSKVINNVFLKSNTLSIIYYYLHKRKIIIEPFDYNPTHKQMLIPPLTGVHNLIDYMNQMSVFYKNGYRYFVDFKRAYLLSNSGKGIEIAGSKDYTSIHINISHYQDDNMYLKGITKNKENKCYELQIPQFEVSTHIDKNASKLVNMYYGVDSDGDVKKRKINLNQDKEEANKPYLYRIYNNNNKIVAASANQDGSSRYIISFQKADIDMSLIEPHKEYNIKFDKECKMKGANGKYLLVGKKEIFAKSDGDGFGGNLVVTFRRIAEKAMKDKD